jgi:hypothetical protein
MVVSVGLAWLLVRASGSRLRLTRLRRLHANQTGGVQSLSFVLTFPLFTMIMMFIVQMSQLIIGEVIVHYAAFAAARSAMVWIPANLGPGYEQENCISTITPVSNVANGTVYQVTPGTPKYQQIEYAAALACLSICPSRASGFQLSGDASPALNVIQSLFAALDPDMKKNPQINQRLANKLAYTLANTSIKMTIWHYDNQNDPKAEPLLQQYLNLVPGKPIPGRPLPPIKINRTLDERPDWYNPMGDEFRPNEVSWKDPITVTVTHQFALLPGPGRLLAKFAPATGSVTDPISSRIRQQNGLYVYPITASATLGNEGEKPVIPYVERTPTPPMVGTASSNGGATALNGGGGTMGIGGGGGGMF